MTLPVHKLLFTCAIIFIVLINLPTQAQNTDQTTITDVLTTQNEETSEFTTLLQALEAADYTELLADPNLRFMLFAPTDEAFAAYIENAATELETLLASPDMLSAVLAYHISTEPFTTEALSSQTSVTTLAGLSITIKTPGTDILLNNRVSLSGTSYLADNGIIHVVDTVLARPRNVVDSSEPDITITPTPEGDDIVSDDNEDNVVSATTTPITDDLDADTATLSEDDSAATDTTPNSTDEAAAEDSDGSEIPEPTEEAEDVAVTATQSSQPTLPQNGDGECIVFIEVEEQADVRVGPGNNRTGITFLDVDVEYTVIAYSIDERDIIWYQLDREEAAPNRAIDEAWVSSEEVSTDGDCTDLDFNEGTPVIPLDGDDTAEG